MLALDGHIQRRWRRQATEGCTLSAASRLGREPTLQQDLGGAVVSRLDFF